MNILKFGKDKDELFGENKKEHENMAKRKDRNLDEEHDENISIDDNYIDPDDLDYCEYSDIIDTIEENGWIPISPAGLSPISHFNSDIIHIKQAKRNTYESILEIICPPENIIAICGFNQEDIDKDDFFNSPNLYTIPHFFTLRLTDDNNNEIPYTTIIGITKIAKNGDAKKLYEEFYGDLCPTIDGKLKKKENRYYFAETIILQGGEKLVFHAYWPFIDIAKIELLMMADVFVRE
jgi:hypothetical protein